MSIMSRNDAVLERLFSRYRLALAANRTGGPRAKSLATAEAVIEARVLLFEHLVSTGWAAPPDVKRQLAVDALLLEQPPSLLAG
ncbi:MAG: hypothetical protein QOJ79_571 [Actinomycetota bacterium]|jgi:hypothetical protein|nr:hypothetical protein [Actinomycetota bacterium]